MRDRRYTILSTSSLPLERIGQIPDSIQIRVLPFTEINARTDDFTISQIKALTENNSTVIFTSAHAVKFVADSLTRKPDWKIYCLRNETRIAVVNYFGSNSIVNIANNALSLSQFLIDDKVKEAVFFCGDQRMYILPDKLKKNGIQLTELIVYDTRLTPERIEEWPDAILFFSPTAVESFFSINELSTETIVFVIGKTTEAAVKKFTAAPVIISPLPDKAFVFNMAMEYAASHPIT
jgi:uroporphyrinogen-III synthase